MTDTKPTLSAVSSTRERMIRAVGAVYEGCADPVDTPSNWARASKAVDAMLDEMRFTDDAVLDRGRMMIADQEVIWAWEAMIDALKVEA